MEYGNSWLVKCRHSTVCDLECKHKEEHHPCKDGGDLPCDLHVHLCLGLDGKRIPAKFDGKCVFTRRIAEGG